MLNRRQMLLTSASLSSTMLGLERISLANEAKRSSSPTIAAFTKSFQTWTIPEVCQKFRSIGLDGLDLTVRPGGHIHPDQIKQQLPEAAKAAKEAGTNIVQITSGVTDDGQYAEDLFSTAAEIGVTNIKLGYYKSGKLGTLQQEIDRTKSRIEQVVHRAKAYGVKPCVHIHSGNYIPSHGTMLYELLRDFDPADVGAYVDTLHMVLEGGKGGWQQGLDLLAPWISLVAVKNFRYVAKGRDKFGQQQWNTQVVPIADGVSPIPQFVGTLVKLGYTGPYSLHSEYKGGHSFKNLSTEECLEQTKADLKHFRRLFT